VIGGRFGIGVVGCGETSAAHHRADRGLADSRQLVAGADVAEPAARRRARLMAPR
jgi:hypothetical protein